MDKGTQHIKKNRFRWLWLLSIAILVLIGFRYSLKSDFVLHRIQTLIETSLAENIHGKATINSISGDAWQYISLNGIEIKSEHIVAQIQQIEIEFSIFDLLFGSADIAQISVNSIISSTDLDSWLESQESTFDMEESSGRAINIQSLILNKSEFNITSSEYLPDSLVSISNLNFIGSLNLQEQSSIAISQLDFVLKSGSLPEVLKMNVTGSVSEEEINLNDIVIGVGKNMINGSLNYSGSDESIEGGLSSSLINIDDLFAVNTLSLDEANVELELSGDISDFTITVLIDSPQIKDGKLSMTLGYVEEWLVKEVGLFAEYLNLSHANYPNGLAGGPIEINAEGEYLPSNNYAEVQWQGGASNFEFGNIHLENISTKGSIIDDRIENEIKVLNANSEYISANVEVDNIFQNSPSWLVHYGLRNFNMANYNADLVQTEINASGMIKGHSLSSLDSTISLSLKNIDQITGNRTAFTIYEEDIDELDLEIKLSTQQLITDGLIKIGSGLFDVEIQAFNPFDWDAEYTYQIGFDDINLGEFNVFEGNTSNLTGDIYGIGRNWNPQEANIFGTLSLKNGTINNSGIEEFSSTVVYESGVINVREGELKSEIADGSIEGRRNIFDVTDPENRFNLDLEVKDIQPLAGFFGREILGAKGNLKGEITQNVQNQLVGNFDLNLEDILVDSIFEASSIVGYSILEIEEKRHFNANLGIVNPLINGIVFQDILIQTNGFINEDSLSSDFYLTIVGSERGRLIQQGNLQKDIKNEITDIRFTGFDFVTTESDLLLQKPFNVRIHKETFGTDTLFLAAENKANLQFSIPFASSDENIAFMKGEDFDLGIIQEIVFGERYLEGIASGELRYEQTPNNVIGSGNLHIKKLNYKKAKSDSLLLGFDIINDQLNLKGSLYWDSVPKIEAWATIPFVREKEELDDEFFKRSVRGELEANSINLDRFADFLSEFDIENTTGIASISGSMSGQAGLPVFKGIIEVDEPQLSGIPVDRVSAEFNYNNSVKNIIVQGEIYAQNTPIAELNVAYPLDIDFRNFDVILPSDEDEIQIKAITNDLNIALFNDFVDPTYMNSMRGWLNINLDFYGPIGDIQPNGFFNLRSGSMQIPEMGISLRNMAMQLDVNEDELQISRMYAESGRGRISANGHADLDGIIPTNLELNVDSRLFQLFNTRDLNLVVDIDATMLGKATQPELTGNVIINNGYYFVSNFGEEAIEEIILEDEEQISFSPFDSLSIDMIIEMRRDFFVRSRDFLDMELQPRGSLDIVKSRNEEIQLFGTLTIDEGYIRPLGKRFTAREGSLVFIGDVDNPELDIQGTYIPQTRQKGESVVLYYLIGGTRYNPEFAFESDPFMEQGDVVCYTLFNKPCYSLESWQSVFAEGNDVQAFQVLSDVLLDQVETLATRELGVDVVQIDNSGQNGATAIRTGWYLNERTFFSIINELTSSTPKTLFVLEYLLNENWDLIITQGDDSRQGIDVRYQFDY